MDDAAAPLDVLGKLREVEIEMLHDLALEFARAFTQPLKARDLADRREAVCVEAKGRRPIRLLEVGVAQCLPAQLANLIAVDAVLTHAMLPADQPWLASTSARCRVLSGSRCRWISPAKCIRQPESLATR